MYIHTKKYQGQCFNTSIMMESLKNLAYFCADMYVKSDITSLQNLVYIISTRQTIIIYLCAAVRNSVYYYTIATGE